MLSPAAKIPIVAVDGEPPRPTIGWREWVLMPELGISRIKAKVDTGARTSALHAFNISYTTRQGAKWVLFDVHPSQRNTKQVVHCEARLIEERYVCDSGGKRTLRPVILATVILHERSQKIELTLVSRDEMGFRMLIGRQAIRGRFVVDPGRSYLGGRPKKKKSKKTKKSKVQTGAKSELAGKAKPSPRDKPRGGTGEGKKP